nr:nicotinate phosphoribosyltransferase [Nitrospinaceae bacterium]
VVRGVRLDSGNLAEHAVAVRKILDEGGLKDVSIFASGNLDESALQEFVQMQAPLNGFGIGTRVTTSEDAPSLNCAYKLQEYAGRPRRKRSEGKATWPGAKQVLREYDDRGRMVGDRLVLSKESGAGEPLIEPVLRAGRRLHFPPSPARIRERAAHQLQRLPDPLRALKTDPPYPVEISQALRDLADSLDRQNR